MTRPVLDYDPGSPEAQRGKVRFAETCEAEKPRKPTGGKRKRPSASEHQIQKSLVDHLKLFAYPDVYWTAIPNGGQRSKAVAGKLKAEGVRAGAPDLLFIANGSVLGLELKTKSGTQSPAQIDTEGLWRRAGGQYAVVYGLDDALGFLMWAKIIRPSAVRS
jgi:hypothetical protein